MKKSNKKSKIDKLAESLFKKLNDQKNNLYTNESKVEVSYNDYIWSEYDSSVSEKTKKLIFRTCEYKNKVHIEINESLIRLTCDQMSNLKSNSTSNKTRKEEYLRIEIIKDKGFSINKDYSESCNFLDKEMYNEVVNEIKKIYNRLNVEHFNNIYENIIVESGLIRESNLDEILKQ